MMDIMLYTNEVEIDSSANATRGKTGELAKDNDFETCIKCFRQAAKKTLKFEELEIDEEFLIQMMYLLNLDFTIADNGKNVEKYLTGNDSVKLDLDFTEEMQLDELKRCWASLLSENDGKEDLSRTAVKRLYLALKKSSPSVKNIDFDSFYHQIDKLLFDKEPESEQLPQDNTWPKQHKVVNINQTENVKNNKKVAYPNQLKVDTTKNEANMRQNKVSSDQFWDSRNVYIKHKDGQIVNTSGGVHEMVSDKEPPVYFNTSFVAVQSKGDMKPSAPTFNPSGIFEQLIDKVHFTRGGVQQLSVRLKPDYLGDVLIKVIEDKGQLKARLYVDNAQVRNMLRVHATDFQNQVRDQGYNVSEINVYKMSDSLEMGAFNQQSGEKNYKQNRKSGTGFNEQKDGFDVTGIEDYYHYWGSDNRINFMA